MAVCNRAEPHGLDLRPAHDVPLGAAACMAAAGTDSASLAHHRTLLVGDGAVTMASERYSRIGRRSA